MVRANYAHKHTACFCFNFDLAQFGIIIGLVIICLVYVFILVGFLAAAIRQKQVGNEHYLVSTVRIILPIVFIFIFPLPFTISFLTTESEKALASPLTLQPYVMNWKSKNRVP